MFEISTQISFESHNDDDYGQTFLFYFFFCLICLFCLLFTYFDAPGKQKKNTHQTSIEKE